jgi:hypothetical protein
LYDGRKSEVITYHIENHISNDDLPSIALSRTKRALYTKKTNFVFADMSAAEQVTQAFLHVPDKRPVLVFEHEDSAAAFAKQYPGAEIYSHKTHVFLPTPFGLELVLGGPDGKTAFRAFDSQP